eukprot:PhF_6_TR28301/c0_g1_i1/m.41916
MSSSLEEDSDSFPSLSIFRGRRGESYFTYGTMSAASIVLGITVSRKIRQYKTLSYDFFMFLIKTKNAAQGTLPDVFPSLVPVLLMRPIDVSHVLTAQVPHRGVSSMMMERNIGGYIPSSGITLSTSPSDSLDLLHSIKACVRDTAWRKALAMHTATALAKGKGRIVDFETSRGQELEANLTSLFANGRNLTALELYATDLKRRNVSHQLDTETFSSLLNASRKYQRWDVALHIVRSHVLPMSSPDPSILHSGIAAVALHSWQMTLQIFHKMRSLEGADPLGAVKQVAISLHHARKDVFLRELLRLYPMDEGKRLEIEFLVGQGPSDWESALTALNKIPSWTIDHMIGVVPLLPRKNPHVSSMFSGMIQSSKLENWGTLPSHDNVFRLSQSLLRLAVGANRAPCPHSRGAARGLEDVCLAVLNRTCEERPQAISSELVENLLSVCAMTSSWEHCTQIAQQTFVLNTHTPTRVQANVLLYALRSLKRYDDVLFYCQSRLRDSISSGDRALWATIAHSDKGDWRKCLLILRTLSLHQKHSDHLKQISEKVIECCIERGVLCQPEVVKTLNSCVSWTS